LLWQIPDTGLYLSVNPAHSGSTLESRCKHSGSTLESRCKHSGSTLESRCKQTQNHENSNAYVEIQSINCIIFSLNSGLFSKN